MKLKIDYPDNFAKVMMYLKYQALEGIPAYLQDFPTQTKDPADIWERMKPRVVYKKDPPGVELFQTYPTLFYDNYYGIPGAGDCDCFSISLLTAAFANDLPYKVVLAGRSRRYPVHIWVKIKGANLDLTRPEFDTTRPYPYIQEFSYPNK